MQKCPFIGDFLLPNFETLEWGVIAEDWVKSLSRL